MNNKTLIVEKLKNDKNIQRYRELELIINNNQSIKNKLDELKTLQKEIVHAESLNKTNSHKLLKDKYDNLYNEFIEQPLIGEYLELQTLLNDFLQAFTNIVEEGIKADLNSN